MEVQIDWFAGWLSPFFLLLLVCVFALIFLAISDDAKGGHKQGVIHRLTVAATVGTGISCAIIVLAFFANSTAPVAEQIEHYYGIELGEAESAATNDIVASTSYSQYAPLLKVSISDDMTGYMINGMSDDDMYVMPGDEGAEDALAKRYIIVPSSETTKKDDGYIYRHIDLYEYDLNISSGELTELTREVITNPF